MAFLGGLNEVRDMWAAPCVPAATHTFTHICTHK